VVLLATEHAALRLQHAASFDVVTALRRGESISSLNAIEGAPAILDQLRRAGALVDDLPPQNAPAAAYWSTLPRTRRTLAWITLTAAAATDIERLLAANEVTVSRDGDGEVVLVTTDDYLHPDLPAIARHETRPWLLARPVGRSILLGPLFGAGDGSCWFCLAHWLKTRRWQQGSLVGWSDDDCPPQPAEAGLPSSFALASGWIANAIAVLVATGSLPLRRTIQMIDTQSLAMSEHQVICRAGCPNRPEGGGLPATLAGWADPLLGIADDFTATSKAVGGFYHVRCQYYRPLPRPGIRPLLHPGTAYGRGPTREIAETSCIGEVLERYCATWQGDEPVTRATIDDIGGLHPERLLHFSEGQYQDRELSIRKFGPGFPGRVPPRLQEGRAIDWVRAHGLKGDDAWLPASLCYMWYPLNEREGFGIANTNGVAAGMTREEAIVGALLELIERDAVAIWWYNRLRRPAIPPASFGSGDFSSLCDALAGEGIDVSLLDITTDLRIPTYVAVGFDQSDASLHIGSAAAFHAAVAAERAVSEMSQMWFWSRQTPEGDGVRNLLQGMTPVTDHFLAPYGTIDPEPPHIDSLSGCLEHLVVAGLNPLVVDLTRPEIRVPVVRVVVPELRHCWHRLGPGRLHDVPIRMGWLSAPSKETDLNPRLCPI
jgi:oxazoline/thiazoline synthase